MACRPAVPLYRTGTRLAWPDAILACGDDGIVVWAATGARPERSLPLAAARPGVHAISLAAAGEDPRRGNVALWLARRLAAEAAACGDPGRVVITSPADPDTTMGLTHICRQVTLLGPGQPTTTTVSELLIGDPLALRRPTFRQRTGVRTGVRASGEQPPIPSGDGEATQGPVSGQRGTKPHEQEPTGADRTRPAAGDRHQHTPKEQQ